MNMIETKAFNEMTDDELVNVDGGLLGLLTFGGAVIGFTLAYRDEIASGLVDGWNSLMNK